MAKVTISNVVVKDNPCVFNHPFQFEITFECIENLNDGTYVVIRTRMNAYYVLCNVVTIDIIR